MTQLSSHTILAAVLVLEPARVKVNEDAEEAHFCFLIEDRMDGCPVPFPFQIYLSTITGTAGKYIFC